MSMPNKVYTWESDGPEVIANFLKLNKDQVEYIRAELVDNLIDAIENFQCSGGLSIAIKGSIKAIRGEDK